MRLKILSVFCTLLGLTVTLPLEESYQPPTKNTALEQTVLDLIESLRDIMLQGNDDIPVLDPLEVDYLHVDLESMFGIQDSHVTLSGATVKQLSTFVIDNLTITTTSLLLQRYSFELDGHIPALEADVDNYKMDVTVMDVNVFGDGSTKVKFIEPRIKVTMEIGVSIGIISGISVSIRTSHVQFFLTGFESEVTGMFDGDEFSNDFISLFLSHLVPELVEFFEPEITETLSDIVMTVGNEILSDLNLSDILGRTGVLQYLNLQPLEMAVDPTVA